METVRSHTHTHTHLHKYVNARQIKQIGYARQSRCWEMQSGRSESYVLAHFASLELWEIVGVLW